MTMLSVLTHSWKEIGKRSEHDFAAEVMATAGAAR